MMTLRNLVLLFGLFYCQFVLAQDTIAKKLQEVVISDTYLKKYSLAQNLITLSDSIISRNNPSLTALLNYNSTIYFKENGLGMVSSPSFRGTTAQQTAVIWNGININSQLNGQTDFNTITTKNFDNITIRAGGGSAIYGSSAIGGSIHLNNDLVFDNSIFNDFQFNYGSFNTVGIHFNSKISTPKIAAQIGFSRNSSSNDYNYVGVYDWEGNQRKNTNGEYSNNNWIANFGYKLNSNHFLKFYSQTSSSFRNFSLIYESDTKTKYVDEFSRNLLEFDAKYNLFSVNLKNAFTYENYQYYGNISSTDFSSGKVESVLSKADFGYKISKSMHLNSLFDYNRSRGYGSSINDVVRQIGSASLLFTHKLDHWQTEFGIRKEATSAYASPLLFSLGNAFQFHSIYELKINISRNFRIPTFNDLYYSGGGGFGNPNLKPESSYQAEIGNVFKFKKITLSQTGYFIKIEDFISWKPSTNGNWSPINFKKINTYGLESVLHYDNNFNAHHFNLNATYAYTISKDVETNKQLYYVPFHKMTGLVGYGFAKLSVNYQFLYNGFVFTLLDNNPKQIVKSYKISNLSVDYNFLKSLKIGLQASNIFNQKYQSVEGRFMPGRNFNILTNFKF